MDCAGAVVRAIAEFARETLAEDRSVCVALSGGPDSLALTAGALRAGLSVHAIVVDHRLQDGSAEVAAVAAGTAEKLGASAEVVPISVGTAGGLEAAAREARYAALRTVAAGRPVLLGHTLDDQAETVLLGLGRGSGVRSIAGMRRWAPPWGRPLLGIRRADTVGACAQWNLVPHTDPHNSADRFTRVRLRTEVLPLLEDVLAGGVAEALARTADQLRDDLDALDPIAAEVYRAARTETHGTPALVVGTLIDRPTAVRRRVLRLWLREVGATEPTSPVIVAVDDLLAHYRGQGGVAIGGDAASRLEVVRVSDVLTLRTTPRRTP